MTNRCTLRGRVSAHLIALTLLFLLGGARWARTEDADRKALLAGVEEIGAPGVPGPLCVFGEAVPVVAGKSGRGLVLPVVAAARWGKGRVVALGHTGYLDAATLQAADTGKLMENAVRWTASQSGGRPVRVAVRRLPGMAERLKQQGFRAAELNEADWIAKLRYADVVCLRPSSLGPEEIARVAGFVQGGGGLIAADLGWGWLQLNPGKSIVEHPGNRLLGPAGILWADGTLERSAKEGFSTVAPPVATHAGRALEAMLAGASSPAKSGPGRLEVAQASATVLLAARTLPAEDRLLRPKFLAVGQRAAIAVPGPKQPIRVEDALKRLSVTLENEELARQSPEQVKPHAAARSFPGEVPADAPRVRRTVAIDTALSGWHSTGLYAPPGEAIEVGVPEGATGKRLQIRIGAHADRLWHLDIWRRWPEICRQTRLDRPATRIANPFGGLVYVDVPGGCALGVLKVQIAGAVEAPHFVLGQTAAADWPSRRQRPAPWAELEGKRVVLTVPSEHIRKLEDAQELMQFWDRVIEACDELSGRPPQPKKERYVPDVQISAGYMHSGYPIMTHLDVGGLMVDKPGIVAFKQDGAWGFFHEMGHNYQSGDWTFEGTGEVTCNLFSLYVFHRVCGRDDIFDVKVPPRQQAEARRRHRDQGHSFEHWKSDPFLALAMYVELQRQFGWETYRKVLAEYRAAKDRPTTDPQKRDQWLVRFSRATGRNLAPFFQSWGVPTSPEARASVASMPEWMP